MKNYLSLFLGLLLIPISVSAQFDRRGILDITANPLALSNREANLCAQIMTIPKVGLCTSVGFHSDEVVNGNFLAQSTKWSFHLEARIFPFGEPKPVSFKDKTMPYERRKRGVGCFGKKDKKLQKAANAITRGIYIAPGFSLQQERLGFEPLPELNAPITDFNYLIKSKGGALALGCQIRFNHITLGAGYEASVTKPTWSGPKDIFGDRLYTTTYPWKLNIQHGPRFEVGLNF